MDMYPQGLDDDLLDLWDYLDVVWSILEVVVDELGDFWETIKELGAGLEDLAGSDAEAGPDTSDEG